MWRAKPVRPATSATSCETLAVRSASACASRGGCSGAPTCGRWCTPQRVASRPDCVIRAAKPSVGCCVRASNRHSCDSRQVATNLFMGMSRLSNCGGRQPHSMGWLPVPSQDGRAEMQSMTAAAGFSQGPAYAAHHPAPAVRPACPLANPTSACQMVPAGRVSARPRHSPACPCQPSPARCTPPCPRWSPIALPRRRPAGQTSLCRHFRTPPVGSSPCRCEHPQRPHS